MFIWVMVATLLWGEKTDRPDQGLVYAFAAPGREPMGGHEGAGADTSRPHGGIEPSARLDWLTRRWGNFEAPGTYAFVLFFLL